MHTLHVEVECLGHESQSFKWMCEVLGLIKEERKELTYEVEMTALHCSRTVVAAQYQNKWITNHCWMYPNGGQIL